MNVENSSRCLSGEVCSIANFPGTGCGSIVTDCAGMPDNTACTSGLFCKVGEKCTANVCSGGFVRDCSANNISINSCTYNPDGNPFTIDKYNFASSCNETLRICSSAPLNWQSLIQHSCNKTCGAECEKSSDAVCPSPQCIGSDYYNYSIYGRCNDDCTINVTDDACNLVIETDSEICTNTVVINIDSGANFFSTPYNLTNSSLSNITSGLEDTITAVYLYNNGWKWYYPSHPELSTLFSLEPGKGYILLALSDFDLRMSKATSSFRIRLNKGWNLFGVSSPTTLASLNLNYYSAWRHDKSSGLYSEINPSYTLVSKESYWVYMNSSQTI